MVGSRGEGIETAFSDWDFRVDASDFASVAHSLPELLAPLEPLAEQWDRLSPHWCWMLVVRGPTKIDLIFPDEPHTIEAPWEPNAANLAAIDAHFWDWLLWLRSKEASRKTELVEGELEKLSDHLLRPLGVEWRPSSIPQAIELYRDARNRAESRFGTAVPRDLEAAVLPAFSGVRGS